MKIPSLSKKWFLLFLLTLFLGCGTATTEPTDINDTGGTDTEPTSPGETGTSGKTPWSYHEANWADPTLHAAAFSANQESCQTCHGKNYERQIKGKNCASCHNYPHVALWTNAENHGAGYLADKTNCQQCHGNDFTELKNGKNCSSCHAFPHEAGWVDYQGGHGQTVQVTLGGSVEDCQKCHGNDLKTEKNGQTCFSCHPSYPHDSTWQNTEDHSDYVMDLMSTENCKQCHGETYQGKERDFNADGSPSRKTTSCQECHDTVECTACHGVHGGDIRARGRFLPDSKLIFM